MPFVHWFRHVHTKAILRTIEVLRDPETYVQYAEHLIDIATGNMVARDEGILSIACRRTALSARVLVILTTESLKQKICSAHQHDFYEELRESYPIDTLVAADQAEMLVNM